MEVKESLRQVLPTLYEDLLEALTTKLGEAGVESLEDLRFVEKRDLVELLKSIQCRKLLCAWIVNGKWIWKIITLGYAFFNVRGMVLCCSTVIMPTLYSHCQNLLCGFACYAEYPHCTFLDGSKVEVPEAAVSSSPINHPETSPCSASSSTVQQSPAALKAADDDPNWAGYFVFKWQKVPADVINARNEGKRPRHSDRRALVRRIADDMREHHSNPTLAQVNSVVKKIVKRFPLSFEGRCNGERIESGYTSLASQVKTRIQHLNRDNTTPRLRKQKQPDTDSDSRHTASNPGDTYGCVSWQPDELPEGKDVPILEAKQKEMQD